MESLNIAETVTNKPKLHLSSTGKTLIALTGMLIQSVLNTETHTVSKYQEV